MNAPPLSEASLPARRALSALGRRYLALGWVFGTSGNLSARVPGEPGRAVVTASGCHKGDLVDDDFVEVDRDGAVLAAGPGRRPSAETSLHLAVYAAFPEATCALHVHTVASTLLAPNAPGSPPYAAIGGAGADGIEMIKGYGLWDDGAVARIPIFANHAEVPRIAEEVAAHYRGAQDVADAVPAFVIRGHGITAWGASVFDANRHVEVTEFLCRVLRARGADGDGPGRGRS